jgi:hypothetical protein
MRPPLAVTVRDRLGEWLHNENFAGGTRRGRPGWPPSRPALITVPQLADNLDDRAAADAVRDRMPRRYALGLGRDDPHVGICQAPVPVRSAARAMPSCLAKRPRNASDNRIGSARTPQLVNVRTRGHLLSSII